MAFTYLTSNKNNIIRVIRLPVEIVCIQAKRIFGTVRSRKKVTLRWDLPINIKDCSLPLQNIQLCRIKEVKLVESRIIPLKKAVGKVVVEICYLVKIEVVYKDSAGNVGMTVLQEKLRRRSCPLPGTSVMSGAADIDLELLHCYIEN